MPRHGPLLPAYLEFMLATKAASSAALSLHLRSLFLEWIIPIRSHKNAYLICVNSCSRRMLGYVYSSSVLVSSSNQASVLVEREIKYAKMQNYQAVRYHLAAGLCQCARDDLWADRRRQIKRGEKRSCASYRARVRADHVA